MFVESGTRVLRVFELKLMGRDEYDLLILIIIKTSIRKLYNSSFRCIILGDQIRFKLDPVINLYRKHLIAWLKKLTILVVSMDIISIFVKL